MARTLETPIQKRFSDVDPFQHVNNVSQQMYFDVGKMEFYEKVLGAETCGFSPSRPRPPTWGRSGCTTPCG